ncbi:N-acetylmuramoyl-L-alanine amidase [soil metagenome]
MRRLLAGALVGVTVVVLGAVAERPAVAPGAAALDSTAALERPVAPAPRDAAPRKVPDRGPLAGKVVVIDAGHQLGNRHFPEQVNRLVPAGGFDKPCNTTGTSTDAGYPEATFTWQVSQRVVRQLTRLGAKVIQTRHSNSDATWGPCVDVRGRAGNGARHGRGADLKLSIHGDGSYAAGAHGFHVIAPTDRTPWTHDIYRPSRRFAKLTRASLRQAGLPYATYIAGGDGLDFRSDLGTLNLSDVPTAMVELGNMRDAGDAARMSSRKGRATYADALVRAVLKGLR